MPLLAVILAGSTPLAVPPDTAPMALPAEQAAPAPADPAPTNPTEIVVQAAPKPPKEDPLRGVNAQTFVVVSKVDGAVVRPIAMAYKHVLPEPARDGLHNALSNLTEPVVFVNDLLQLKPGRAVKTLGRFLINSTVGLAGLFDVAKKKPFHLAHHNNGFANTLGFYGVGPGPYLYLPLIGATTLRDMFGRVIDLSLLPAAAGAPFNNPSFSLPNSALKSIDDRVTYDGRQLDFEAQPDPYAAERAFYLQARADEIAALHSHKPEQPAPAAPAPTPAPPP